jgi:hypothetical protein
LSAVGKDIPPKTTAYPFVPPSSPVPGGTKRKKIEDDSSFFWTENPEPAALARSRAPPESYVCNICREPGHYIKDCPQKGQQRGNKRGPPAACWFCLSNPDIEQHLIIALGEGVYVALAKGQLSEEGHLILVPVGHCASYRGLEVGGEVQMEMDKTQGIVRKAFEERGYFIIS